MYRSDGPPELRSVGEVEFANGAAAMGASGVYGNVRVCAAIVAYGDLLLGSRLAPVLEQYLNVSGRRVRGVCDRSRLGTRILPPAARSLIRRLIC